jgi:hypothetical protein
MSRDEGSTSITSPGVSNATTINPARFFTMEGGLGDNIIHVINPASLGSLASVTTSATNSGLPANMQTITIQPGTFPIPINLAQWKLSLRLGTLLLHLEADKKKQKNKYIR